MYTEVRTHNTNLCFRGGAVPGGREGGELCLATGRGFLGAGYTDSPHLVGTHRTTHAHRGQLSIRYPSPAPTKLPPGSLGAPPSE